MDAKYIFIKNLQGNVANRKLFYADQNDPTTFPEIKNKSEIAAGSELRVIKDGAKYILNSEYEWELTPDSGGGGGGGGVPEAPSNGNTYGRKDKSWVNIEGGGGGGGGGIIFFSTANDYATGDIVSYQGMLWKAVADVSPGPFVLNQWASLATQVHQYTTGQAYAKGEIVVVNNDPFSEGRKLGMYYVEIAFTAVSWVLDLSKLTPLIVLSTNAMNEAVLDSTGALFVRKTTIPDYSTSTSYSLGDLVDFAGTIYQCSVGSAPVGPFQPSNWTQRGSQYFPSTPYSGQYVPRSSIILNIDSFFYVTTGFTATGTWNTDKNNCKPLGDITLSNNPENALKKLSDTSLFVQGEVPNSKRVFIDFERVDSNGIYLGTSLNPFNSMAQYSSTYGNTSSAIVLRNARNATLNLDAEYGDLLFLAENDLYQNRINRVVITGHPINLSFKNLQIQSMTLTRQDFYFHFEDCEIVSELTFNDPNGTAIEFLRCNFRSNLNFACQGGFLTCRDCRFKFGAALIIDNTSQVFLINNSEIAVEQRGPSVVIAHGSNIFSVPNNISSTYGYVFATGADWRSRTAFFGGKVVDADSLAPIYFLNGSLGTFSLGDLLFDVENSVISVTKESLTGLAARQIVDKQTFQTIAPISERQSDINKAFDTFIQNISSPGTDRGVVLNAFVGNSYYGFPTGSAIISSGGSGYNLKDVLFIEVQDTAEQLLKAWVIVDTIGAGGTITSASISSQGAYTAAQTGPFNTFTTGVGTGAQINFSSNVTIASTLNSIPDPTEGDRATVLIDETNNNERWIWQYADMNGDGVSNWIPLVLDSTSTDYSGDGVYINITDGVITFDPSSILTQDDVVVLGDVVQIVNGFKTFTTNIAIPSKATLPTFPSSTSPATEAQVGTRLQADTTANIVYGTGDLGVVSNRSIDTFAMKATSNTFTAQNIFQNFSPTVPSKDTAAGANPTVIATEAQVNLKGDRIDGNNKVYTTNGSGAATPKDLADFALKAGDNVFTGQNTFSNYSPVVPNKNSDAANSGTAIATEAQVFKKMDRPTLNNIVYTNDGSGNFSGEATTNFVKITGDQTISGLKTFSTNPSIPSVSILPGTPSSTKPATEAQVATRLAYLDSSNIVYTNNGSKALTGVQIGAFAQVGVNNDFTAINTFTVQPELKGVARKTGMPSDETGAYFATETQLLNMGITPYELPKASGSVLGGIKVGSGLAINGDGVLSAPAQSFPDSLSSSEDGLTTPGVSKAYVTSYLSPITPGATASVGDTVYFNNNTVGEITNVAGSVYTAVTLMVAGITTFANIQGSYTDNTSLNNAISGKLTKPTGTTAQVLDGVGTPKNLSIDWNDVSGKPSTFAPIIGTGGDQAMAGNSQFKTIGGTSITGSGNINFPTVQQSYSSSIADAISGVGVAAAGFLNWDQIKQALLDLPTA